MKFKCVKIKLKPAGLDRARQWAAEIRRRPSEAVATLKDEGVVLECAFIDSSDAGDFLIYFMRAENFDRARRVADQSTHPIDAFHRAFKEECWAERQHLELLVELAVEESCTRGDAAGLEEDVPRK